LLLVFNGTLIPLIVMIFADGLIIKTSDSGGVVLPATTTKEMKQFFALPFELRFSTAGLEPAT